MTSRTIPTAEDMENFAAQCAEHSGELHTLYFKGELGAGKTTFVRGFLHKLGHVGPVKSPTYTLVEPYSVEGRMIYHFDLFRLNDPEELEAIGVRDYFSSSALCLVEWPEKAHEFLPQADVLISIDYLDDGRQIRLTANTEPGDQFLQKLKSD